MGSTEMIGIAYFGPSRDLLYLFSLLLGTGAGAFLKTLRPSCTSRKRSNLITVILCLSACAVASLAGAVILSRALIFTVSSIYPVMALFLILGAVGFFFPRMGGCVIVFAAGLFAVWVCFSFIIYPNITDPVRLALRSSENEIIFRHNEDTITVINVNQIITFEAASITAHPAYPLIGGEQRGLITRVMRGNEFLFTLTSQRYKFSGRPGFIIEDHALDLHPEAIPPGISLSVLFNGKILYFDPPLVH
jgi:hypothetical protein